VPDTLKCAEITSLSLSSVPRLVPRHPERDGPRVLHQLAAMRGKRRSIATTS